MDRGAVTVAPRDGFRRIRVAATCGPCSVLLALVLFPVIWVLFIASGTSFGPAVSDPKDFFITLLNGLTAAALYFVVATGFTLIFGLMRVVNMAHGAFFLLGGYIALHIQRNMVGSGGALGLSSAQVSLAQWVLPAHRRDRHRRRHRPADAAGRCCAGTRARTCARR